MRSAGNSHHKGTNRQSAYQIGLLLWCSACQSVMWKSSAHSRATAIRRWI